MFRFIKCLNIWLDQSWFSFEFLGKKKTSYKAFANRLSIQLKNKTNWDKVNRIFLFSGPTFDLCLWSYLTINNSRTKTIEGEKIKDFFFFFFTFGPTLSIYVFMTINLLTLFSFPLKSSMCDVFWSKGWQIFKSKFKFANYIVS